MHRERLEQMVVMLRGLPEEGPVKFHIGDWFDDLLSCGTAACAVGHACLNPVFKEQGLGLDKQTIFPNPKFQGEFGWRAVELFFDIEPANAKYLFLGDEYTHGEETTAVEVADRIESFLAEHAEAV
jgi:hypothetical protein